MAAGIKPDSAAIKQYYRMLEGAEDQEALHEGNVRRAFETLLRETARDAKKWELVTEQSERRGASLVRYDGVLRDQWRLPHGYWEAKDTRDDLDTEIRKKREKGYPLTNIIFEDTREAVLFQDNDLIFRADVRQPDQLADLLTRFFSHDIPPFVKFGEAVTYFQGVIPEIAGGLKSRIEAAHRENRRFQDAFNAFMEVCKASLNPNISPAAVDEMLIQHMLTARLIAKIFTEGFTQRNAIAAEIETVIGALTSAHFNPKDFLGALDRFYTAIEDAAEKLADYSQKQTFINTVYERFFQGYSVKVADTHGIVYTPQPIVDFMCAAVEEVLLTEFGKKLGDAGVYIIDPCTGTGNFAVNLLRRAHERNPRGFDRFYREQLFANEVMLMPYYIASLNIEHEYFALSGKYEPFEGVCFVDTLDLAERADGQMGFSFMTEKNAARVERQKRAPITVIIGNPPYNVGQLDENDNNKNRKYEVIDDRVAKTYSKDSKATSKSKLNDPYVKFFRWAADRLGGRDGVVCYVSNNSFVDQIAFDGMRKHLLNDFTAVYHLDLHGNVRQNPKLSGTTHNVFGIQVGVGVTVAVRSSKQPHPQQGKEPHPQPLPMHGEGSVDSSPMFGGGWEGDKITSQGREGDNTKPPARLLYHRVPEFWTRAEKLAFLADHVERMGRENALNTVEWTTLTPDNRHTWLVPENADEFSAFIPIGSKETKVAKGNVEAIFKVYSLGVTTARDEVVYDFDHSILQSRVKEFVEKYNAEVDRYKRSGGKREVDSFVNYDEIKWSATLKLNLSRGRYATYEPEKTRNCLYRPFCRQYLYYDTILNERPREFGRIFPKPETEQDNQAIIIGGYGRKDFAVSLTNTIYDLNFYADPAQCFPFYAYDEDGNNRRENITDWALKQFQERYAAPLTMLGEGQGVGMSSTSHDTPKGWALSYQNSPLYQKIKPFARQMRSEPTAAENHLWQRIRHKQIGGYKFRRQHVIDRFIVDFYCAEARLVIEVDGPTHDYTQEEDALRTAFLESLGLRVLRFTNGEVLQHVEAVAQRIDEVLQGEHPHPQQGEYPHPQPLPMHGEGSQDSAIVQNRPETASPDSSPMFDDTTLDSSAMFDDPRSSSSPMFGGGREGDNNPREITKWDIFYYVYGLLHHPEYRAKFADNLKKELPRIPFAPDFWAFAEAGKRLADLHLNYETVEPYPLEWVTTPGKPISYRVEKMRLNKEKTALQVNSTLTLNNIPAEAFEYRLGNRSALDWVVDQYQVSTDKRSGITSDPNRSSDDKRHTFDLVERVVRVSVDTVAIVKALPGFSAAADAAD